MEPGAVTGELRLGQCAPSSGARLLRVGDDNAPNTATPEGPSPPAQAPARLDLESYWRCCDYSEISYLRVIVWLQRSY